ncbi:MAG: methylenetetrahydrofolate reductase, partial [Dehalococcoidia bacterium]|nr:methylenetetrahydrofolate reductase [Dehalococcoidia bacterium]
DSANVFDLDSVQLISMINAMAEEGVLLNGRKIEGPFAMLVGAAANPELRPLELNVMRVKKKVRAGARFLQTQAVFDIEGFKLWLDALRAEGIAQKTAILAGVLPLSGAAEAKRLKDTFTDFNIPDDVITRLESAGGEEAQRKEGLAVCADTIGKLKALPGLRGIHIFSGGNESAVPALISMAL